MSQAVPKNETTPMSVNLPFIKVKVGQRELPALIDSGSSINAISQKCFELVGKKLIRSLMDESKKQVVSIGGTAVNIIGLVGIRIKFSTLSWYTKFQILENMPIPILLGYTFMKYTGLILDSENEQISFAHNPLKTYKLQTHDDEEITRFFKKHTAPNCEQNHFSCANYISNGKAKVNRKTYDNGDNKECLDNLQRDNPFKIPDCKWKQINPHIPRVNLTGSEQTALVNTLIEEFPDVLTDKIGEARNYKLKIFMQEDCPPINQPPYPINPINLKYMRQITDNLLKQKVIQPSHSAWASPAFLVAKGGASDDKRLVVNYKRVNEKIKFTAWPLPTIDHIFDHVHGAKFFSVLDLSQAFFQLPLHEDSRKYTAFKTSYGLYEFLRMPMGISLGSQSLTEYLEKIFSDVKYKFVWNYLDDILIYSSSKKKHLQHIRHVLKILRDNGLTLNPDKMKVLQESVKYLGHQLSFNAVGIDPERIQAIKNLESPKTLKQALSFLGLCSFFARFIPNFSEIAAPLHKLKTNNAELVWDLECQNAFRTLKNFLTSPPLLSTPNFNKRFLLYTDASSCAIGSLLSQKDDENNVRPIAFFSKMLQGSEKNYSTYKKELYGVILSFRRFRQYLSHKPFTLYTDCSGLVHFLQGDRGRILNNPAVKWITELDSYSFDVIHVKGKNNNVADYLSRFSDLPKNVELKQEDESMREDTDATFFTSPLSKLPSLFDDFQQSQRDDDYISKKVTQNDPNVKIIRGLTYYIPNGDHNLKKLLVPDCFKEPLFQYFHLNTYGAHQGLSKTLGRIRNLFTYPKMHRDIKQRIAKCEVCMRVKPNTHPYNKILHSTPPIRIMEKLYIDFVGPLPTSTTGNRFIFVAVDAFSKFLFAIPCRNTTTEIVIRTLKGIFSQHGLPTYIISDRQSCFRALTYKNFLFNLGITYIANIPHHPQTNLAERYISGIKKSIRAYHSNSQKHWEENLFIYISALNSARNDTTQNTPSLIFLGRDLQHPLTLKLNIEDNVTHLNQQEMETLLKTTYHNLLQAHKTRLKRYKMVDTLTIPKIGDVVYRKTYILSNKSKNINASLCEKFSGPYKVIKIFNKVSYLIQSINNPETTIHAHITQLKPENKA